MPHSENQPDRNTTLAVIAESLYLINLMLLPGLAFVLLLVIYLRSKNTADPLSRNHLQQTVVTSIWAGALLILVNALIIVLGGYDGPYTWMVVIIYFTTAHSCFILAGVFGLIKALAGQCWSYPLIGPAVPDDC